MKKIEIKTSWLVAAVVVIIMGYAIFLSPNEPKINSTDQFNKISVDQLKELYNAEESALLYVGRPTCPACVEFEPTLSSVASKYELVVNYLNLDVVAQAGDGQAFTEVDPYFASDVWGTPMVLSIGKGKLSEDKLIGAVDEKTLVDYLTKQNIIKE